MTSLRNLSILLVFSFLFAFSARAGDDYIPLLPHPGWFSCQYALECVPVEGACEDWLAVNKRHAGIASRYYGHWQGKKDCTNSKGHKKTDTLCVKRRCTFAP